MNILHQQGNDVTIGTRTPPRLNLKIGEGDMGCQNGVRSYRCSPEDVAIQIRMNNRYVTAHLTLEEARAFARNILEATGAA